MCDQQRLRSACTYAQSDQSLCSSLEYSMTVKLLNEHHLEFLSLKGGCTGSSESIHVKVPHCWKPHSICTPSSRVKSTLELVKALQYFLLTIPRWPTSFVNLFVLLFVFVLSYCHVCFLQPCGRMTSWPSCM